MNGTKALSCRSSRRRRLASTGYATRLPPMANLGSGPGEASISNGGIAGKDSDSGSTCRGGWIAQMHFTLE